MFTLRVSHTKNSSKKIRELIGLKSYFCNSIETKNYGTRSRGNGTSKENLHFGDQSKEVIFFVVVAEYSKREKKHVLRVSIELQKH